MRGFIAGALVVALLPAGARAVRADSLILSSDSESLESEVARGSEFANRTLDFRTSGSCGQSEEGFCKQANCFWRPTTKPKCAERRPENCIGVRGEDCKKATDICQWKYQEGQWATSCKPLPGHDPDRGRDHGGGNDRGDDRGRKSDAGFVEHVKEAFSQACHFHCWFSFWKDRQCHKAKPIIIFALALVLPILACCVFGGICCCCGSRKAQARANRSDGSLIGRSMPVPSFPEAPGATRIVVDVPVEVQPGQPFNFKHPHTGQVMQTTAPPDGARRIQIQL